MNAATLQRLLLLVGLTAAVWAPEANAQFTNKWLSAGEHHNWYSEIGSECEECGFVRNQQDGWRWPGLYAFTDMQAAKALWIGATNVTDENGASYPQRVVHVGPRVSGAGEFFPTRFEMISRYDPTVVTVDGEQTFSAAEMAVDTVDPTILPDRMIINEANTLLGITMERKIMQFSQEYHDDYHLIEYTFTNTGNTDDDEDIELGNQTLNGVMIFLQYRLSVAAETRYVIGSNPTGWGKHTMNDARGDGVEPDPPGEDFRAQFVWHGNFPPFTAYDNIGGPIMPPAVPALQVAPGDTLGRLGASQFIGVVTMFAEGVPGTGIDDRGQPSTTTWIGSDDPYQSQNDAFSPSGMQTEYQVMTVGHKSPRHAKVVEPTGRPGYLDPTGDPSLGTPGGYSFANGYGPYTLAPGESVQFVIAEASAGLSREANTVLGQQFFQSGGDASAGLTYNGTTMPKNDWVFTGQDSLFQTFERAIENYESGYAIAPAPAPPRVLEVQGGGDRISLTWDVHPDAESPDAWEIYRAQSEFDSTYTLIHTAGAGDRTFDDTTPIRGVDYYYYVVAVKNGAGNGVAGTPNGATLRSSRYFAQTYTPTQLKRPAGASLDEIRIVPNPYNIGSSGSGTAAVRFPDQRDKLAFYNIPGFCTIEIYTELGELVDTIEHTDGSGDEFWDHRTAARQLVASGIYIAVITVTQDVEVDGEIRFRQGDRTFKKFAIIR
ncbi:MAG: hypothetical protein Rubg2KO_36000 [Rubricoccaceae bacterium]